MHLSSFIECVNWNFQLIIWIFFIWLMFDSLKDYAKYTCRKFRQKINRLRLIFNGSKWDVILEGFSRIMCVHFGGKSICNKHEEDEAQFFQRTQTNFPARISILEASSRKTELFISGDEWKTSPFSFLIHFFVCFVRTKAPGNSLTKRFFLRRHRFKRNSSCESIKISIENFFHN